MPHSVENVTAWIEENSRRIAELAADKKARLDALAQQIDAEQKHELDDLRTRQNVLHGDLERARAAVAFHPLEGKRVERTDTHHSRTSWRGSSKTVTLRGIITVAREWGDLPRSNNQTRGHRMPQIGEAFIQRVNAKGAPLEAWELLDKDGGIGRWKVVEEEVVA